MALAVLPNCTSDRNLHDPLYNQYPRLRTNAMEQPASSRPSLPSISSLIEAVNDQTESGTGGSPTFDHGRRISGGSQGQPAASPDKLSLVNSPRSHPPATPELPPASSFDFHRPSEGNNSPTPSHRNSYSSTNPELYAQPRPSSYPPLPETHSSYPPIPEPNQWSSNQSARSPAAGTPQEPSRATAGTLNEGSPEANPYAGLSQQRPLPANFPPPLSSAGLPPIDPQMAPTWQHHHYYPPANPPAYPQSQERYVCPTCNKPFSRPSSLKIHTYSHTGEKPYKCKHDGCGKYFSVRSNMKRHEKGCHGGESASAGENSPQAA